MIEMKKRAKTAVVVQKNTILIFSLKEATVCPSVIFNTKAGEILISAFPLPFDSSLFLRIDSPHSDGQCLLKELKPRSGKSVIQEGRDPMKKNTLAAVLLSRTEKLRLLFFILLALIASFLTIIVHSLFGVEISRSPD
jgi:hypothetical protein